jgi:hypothetical protein
MVLVSWSSRLMVISPSLKHVAARNNSRGPQSALRAHKQASSHGHEMTSKQCVSYNVASVDGVYVKQDDIYRSTKHDDRSRFIVALTGDIFPVTVQIGQHGRTIRRSTQPR